MAAFAVALTCASRARLTQHCVARWTCAAAPRGRGVWDIDATPTEPPYNDRSRSRDRPYEHYATSGRTPAARPARSHNKTSAEYESESTRRERGRAHSDRAEGSRHFQNQKRGTFGKETSTRATRSYRERSAGGKERGDDKRPGRAWDSREGNKNGWPAPSFRERPGRNRGNGEYGSYRRSQTEIVSNPGQRGAKSREPRPTSRWGKWKRREDVYEDVLEAEQDEWSTHVDMDNSSGSPDFYWDGCGAPNHNQRTSTPSEIQLALASETDDLLYGVSPVLAALRQARRELRTLYVQEGRGVVGPGSGFLREEGSSAPAGGSSGSSRKPEHERASSEIQKLAFEHSLRIRRVNKGDLNSLSRGRPHQGFILQASRIDFEDLTTLGPPPLSLDVVDPAASPTVGPVWLVLDEVTDPQNFGALLRSAHFLGAAGVIACKRNSSALTPVVSKASSGALEQITVRGVASMPRFLRSAVADGWRIVGTALGDMAIPARDLQRGPPTLLVLGSEGHGLRPMVRNTCTQLLRIDGAHALPPGDVVDSLNVSVAGAIALHHLLV